MTAANLSILGNLSSSPEERHTPQGDVVVSGSICHNSYGKQGRPLFVRYEIWGNRGQAFMTYARKGDPFFLTGRLDLVGWTNQSGENRTQLQLSVSDWSFAERSRPEGTSREPTTEDRGGDLPDDSLEAPF